MTHRYIILLICILSVSANYVGTDRPHSPEHDTDTLTRRLRSGAVSVRYRGKYIQYHTTTAGNV